MPALEVVVAQAAWAVGVAVLAGGVAGAWASSNLLKRVAAMGVALTGAGLVLAAGGAGGAAAAAVGVAFAYVAIGVALVIRAQEAYGVLEASELDRADAESEPPERGA